MMPSGPAARLHAIVEAGHQNVDAAATSMSTFSYGTSQSSKPVRRVFIGARMRSCRASARWKKSLRPFDDEGSQAAAGRPENRSWRKTTSVSGPQNFFFSGALVDPHLVAR